MRPAWIDTDMGFDDLAAVLMIAASPDLSIAGLSLVAGNAPLEVVADNAGRAAALFGWNIPIHRGRDRPILRTLVTAEQVLGAGAMSTAGRTLPKRVARLSPMDAISALIAELVRSQNALTILALGPLTNLAVALLVRPDLVSRLERVVWMGGSVGPRQPYCGRGIQRCGRPRGGTDRSECRRAVQDDRARCLSPGSGNRRRR